MNRNLFAQCCEMPPADDDPKLPILAFVVYGRPQQRGSKQAMARYGRDGKPVTKNGRVLTFAKDDNPNSTDWMAQVRSAAAIAYGHGRVLVSNPVSVSIRFYFNRPKSHFRSGKNASSLKASAPREHAQSPDLDKLIRCLCDALTGVVIVDDKLIFKLSCCREWTESQERAEVEIYG